MSSNIKVLIVEDDRSSIAAITEVVTRMGHKAVAVMKPADALNVAKLQTVHAAVIDVLLPKMSGVDLAAEFRKTKFAENPIILVSGVFKDKAFAQEAIKKSDAAEFLFKPFAADDLKAALTKALAPYLTNDEWTVQNLLTRQFKSPRERAKAIERLKRIKGLEFPFVLSLLTEAKISGHLNIVSESGEIFGVTLSRGAVTEVDSSESQSTGVLALITKGYLAQDDWEAFQKGGRRKFNLDKLVQEGLVSPHAVTFAKHEQIVEDLKAIFSAESIQVNFVRQDDVEETPGGVVTMGDLLSEISGTLGDFFPVDYLRRFYEPVANSALNLVAGANDMSVVWRHQAFENLDAFRRVVEQGGTLAQASEAAPDKLAETYAALHYLVLNRYVLFEDAARAQTLASLLDRYRKMYAELDGKSPDKVFAYFAGKDRLNPPLVERIFAEYKRSNAPESLPKDAPPELVDLSQKCLNLLTKARAVMVDDGKRQELFESLKAEDVERGKRANELTVKGLDLLRKGQFAKATEALVEAERQQDNALSFLIRTWAEVKGQSITSRDRLGERLAKIEALPPEDRRSVYYHMAVGMVKKALGDRTYPSSFEKAFELDSTMVEARRELNAGAPNPRDKKQDILTGDITQIVTGFFRRRAD